MAPRKTPSPISTETAKQELENLYLRRRLLDNLIRSMEVYERLDHGRKNRSPNAA